MNDTCLKIGAGVDRSVLAPQMCLVEVEAPKSFAKFGHDCWLTSAYRPGDPKLHGCGFAEDFDSSTNVPRETGERVRKDMSRKLGPQYNILWHKTSKGAWHLHVEFDPNNKGVQPFHKKFWGSVVVEV